MLTSSVTLGGRHGHLLMPREEASGGWVNVFYLWMPDLWQRVWHTAGDEPGQLLLCLRCAGSRVFKAPCHQKQQKWAHLVDGASAPCKVTVRQSTLCLSGRRSLSVNLYHHVSQVFSLKIHLCDVGVNRPTGAASHTVKYKILHTDHKWLLLVYIFTNFFIVRLEGALNKQYAVLRQCSLIHVVFVSLDCIPFFSSLIQSRAVLSSNVLYKAGSLGAWAVPQSPGVLWVNTTQSSPSALCGVHTTKSPKDTRLRAVPAVKQKTVSYFLNTYFGPVSLLWLSSCKDSFSAKVTYPEDSRPGFPSTGWSKIFC